MASASADHGRSIAGPPETRLGLHAFGQSRSLPTVRVTDLTVVVVGAGVAWSSVDNAVATLVDLDSTAVRVFDDDAASPIPYLVPGQHGCFQGSQGHYRVVERGDVKAGERASRFAPLRSAAARILCGKEREMNSLMSVA